LNIAIVRASVLLFVTLMLPAQERNPLAGNPGAVEAGRATFLGACSACHGITGQGGTGPNLVSGRAISRMPDRRLFESIKHGVPGTDMPPFALPDGKVWELVSFLRSLAAPAIRAGVQGDTAKGRELFFNKAGCAGCHSVAGQGGVIGPDLSNVGVTRTLLQLRESILEPNARIEPGFDAASAQLASGGRLEGVVKNQNNYSLQLLDIEGRLHLLWRSDVKALMMREGSLMPAGYDQKLTKTEMTDLLAFLSRRTVRTAEDAN
jgi:putative heme-binding domain-containing protein